MGMLHVFLGVNWYVELIASIRIKIGATEAISEAGFECAPCAHTPFFSQLHVWYIISGWNNPSEHVYGFKIGIGTFLAAYRALTHTFHKVYRGRGRNFQDGGFGFSENFIICAQVPNLFRLLHMRVSGIFQRNDSTLTFSKQKYQNWSKI